MREIFSRSSKVLIWLGPNKTGDYLGERRVAPVHLSKNENYKCIWHNDSRDEDMINSYFEEFVRYEGGSAAAELVRDDETIEHDENDESNRLAGGSKLDFLLRQPKSDRLKWSRDVFGAFCVLNRLAQGVRIRNLRILQTSMTSPRQSEWSQKIMRGFKSIADALWWERTWVIQETALAKKATVYFGHMSAPWTMLSSGAAAYTCELASSDLMLIGDDDTRFPLWKLAKAIVDIESIRVAKVDNFRFSLLPLLRRFRTKRSSDPRDKVFALLGLADQQIQASLEPNYNLTKEEVIPRVHARSLLELQGYFVDTICYSTTEAPEHGTTRMRGALDMWTRSWEQWSLGIKYVDNVDAFWRTVSGDLLYIEPTERSHLSDQRYKYRRADSKGLAAFEAWRKDDVGKRNRKSSLGPGGLLKSYVEPEELSTLKNSFHHATLAASASRRFFITTTGLIGIEPAGVQEDDVLYIKDAQAITNSHTD
ncbi:MAG: hypothetical protein Q9165_006789 [Trypethelium subeluteriae]